jgi:hypothetical protein
LELFKDIMIITLIKSVTNFANHKLLVNTLSNICVHYVTKRTWLSKIVSLC